MSDDTSYSAAINTTATTKVYHARLKDIRKYTPEKLQHLQRGGIRSGPGRTDTQSQQILDEIPASQRAGTDSQTAASKVKGYLANKDASHITPHSNNGSSGIDNIKWENKVANRARGDKPMTSYEQVNLDVKAQFDNLTGAVKMGIDAVPKGAAIGAVTTAPLSMLKNALRVIRGEISAQEAALDTVKETAVGGGVGAATALAVTTVASACPPVAIALTAISPALLVAGGASLVYSFFKVLGNHDKQVKAYYKALTQQEIQKLNAIDAQLAHEHERNLEFLANAKVVSEIITNRPQLPEVDMAFARLCESISIANSIGSTPANSKILKLVESSNKLLNPEIY